MCDADGNPLEDDEGQLLLADGKSSTQAVYFFELKWDGLQRSAADCCDACWDAVTTGILFDCIHYVDQKNGIRCLSLVAEMSASHDENSNEWRSVTPQDKVRFVF